mmetsp:Transcript_71237/g.202068  ORF Transcript_71237/g.202068 Transcript_71237/m.202068 type:complete len:523 (+) Transcript_71237:87-1655(+)
MGCSGGKAVLSPPGVQMGGQSAKGQGSSSSTKDPFDTVFILDHTRRIQNFYADEDGGACSIGDLRRVRHKSTQEVRALTTRAKVHVDRPELIKQEIDIRRELDHPNIAKLHETFEDHRHIYLVTELCEGGELLDRVIEAGRITEAQAATVMQQVLSAVLHMHEKRFCHRDLTMDSFSFAGPGALETSVLKLVDFGSATRFEPGQVLSAKVGTSYYVAPEVLARKYDNACDLWSCGVILYVALCGYPPFGGERESETLAQVKSGKFTFKKADWCGISEDAKDLIRGLLKAEPRQRLRADQAVDREWIKSWAPRAPKVPSLPPNFVANLRGFRSQNRLKKAALHIIAGQLKENEMKGLRGVFQALDRNQDGLLSGRELKEGLLKAGLESIPADLMRILDDVDADGSGIVDYTEFLAATLDEQLYAQEDVCWSAFRLLDRDGDGKLSQDELRLVLGGGDAKKLADDKTVEEIMSTVDTSGDGKIDFQEFMAMMSSAARHGCPSATATTARMSSGSCTTSLSSASR